jgi:glucose/galactose transporter
MIENKNSLIIPMLILGVLYFVIGFGVGISGFLTPFLKDALHLTVTQSYLIPVAVFSAFIIFGAPAGWVVKKAGYKKSIVFALLIMSIGMFLFVPSANTKSLSTFLLALYIIGIGKTLLQASINPYVTIIGPQESAASRMCLMGILNKLAWWLSPIFLGIFLNLNNVQLAQVSVPFYIVTFILMTLAVFMYFAPLPEVKAVGESDTKEKNSVSKIKLSVLQFPHLLLGVFTLFFYIGIEVLPMVSIIGFAKTIYGQTASNLESFSKYVPIGMFVGYIFGLLMIPKKITQANALTLFSFIGIIAALCVILLPGKIAIYSLAAIGFANSIMWGAIWPLAIADLGNFTKTGSSYMVMSLVGAAIIPFVFGYLIDFFKTSEFATTTNYQNAYWIFIPAYLFILFFGTIGYKVRKKNTNSF